MMTVLGIALVVDINGFGQCPRVTFRVALLLAALYPLFYLARPIVAYFASVTRPAVRA